VKEIKTGISKKIAYIANVNCLYPNGSRKN